MGVEPKDAARIYLRRRQFITVVGFILMLANFTLGVFHNSLPEHTRQIALVVSIIPILILGYFYSACPACEKKLFTHWGLPANCTHCDANLKY